MRAAFTLSILCLSVFYTYWAFAHLTFLSSTGRLGPGFFPRIIGLCLVAACLAELGSEAVRRSAPPTPSEHIREVAVLIGMTVLFVLALNIVGGYVAMVAFMLATLTILDRRRWLQNVLVSVLLAFAVYLIFDLWLGAAVPQPIDLNRWLSEMSA
jgi:hypothetical protein